MTIKAQDFIQEVKAKKLDSLINIFANGISKSFVLSTISFFPMMNGKSIQVKVKPRDGYQKAIENVNDDGDDSMSWKYKTNIGNLIKGEGRIQPGTGDLILLGKAAKELKKELSL